ncbi:MAG TPA: hypothetical protein VIV06_12340, partial [Candidatus Limnocylindrales bacterium]
MARYLQGAELWRLPPGGEAAARRGGAAAPGGGAAPAEGEAPPEVEAAAPELVAGWEDGATFCTAVCSTDVGLGFCRRCPAELATRVLASGRPGSAECPAGVRMLAFPAPRGDERQAAVLRVAPPTPRAAVRIAERIRVSPRTLRQAALDAEPADARAALAAAGVLRSAGSLFDWQVAQRSRGADGRRTATAALAQMVATSEEFQELYRAAQRQRAEFERNQRRLDRLAREALRTQDVE